jgi:hypothetical protein
LAMTRAFERKECFSLIKYQILFKKMITKRDMLRLIYERVVEHGRRNKETERKPRIIR